MYIKVNAIICVYSSLDIHKNLKLLAIVLLILYVCKALHIAPLIVQDRLGTFGSGYGPSAAGFSNRQGGGGYGGGYGYQSTCPEVGI